MPCRAARNRPGLSGGFAPGALHIPLHELTPGRLHNELEKSGRLGACIYLLCQGGNRAEQAAQQLAGKIDLELCVIL